LSWSIILSIYVIKPAEYTNWQWAKTIAARVLFPPILLWDLSKKAVNALLGKTVGGLVLPAQDIDFSHADIEDPVYLDTERLTHERHTIVTSDGAELDTLEIKHAAQKDTEAQYQRYIISFVGNASAYENTVDDMQNDAEALQCNVVGFNFRGVNHSSGRAKSKDDLVTDGIAQVQRLLDQGVSPQNITLKGNSLGAGIASLVAHHFHQQEKPVNIFNCRSFSSITNFLVGQIRTSDSKTGHEESLGKKILGGILKPIIKVLVSLTQWEIDADSAFKAIPDEYKEYIVVRTNKADRNESVIDDPVISHYTSIHAALKDERQVRKAELDMLIKAKQEAKKQNGAENEMELDTEIAALKSERNRFKTRKMMNNHPYEPNGHIVNMEELVNHKGQTGHTFFREFVQAANEHHAIKPSISLQG
jgi:hypothetical protein